MKKRKNLLHLCNVNGALCTFVGPSKSPRRVQIPTSDVLKLVGLPNGSTVLVFSEQREKGLEQIAFTPTLACKWWYRLEMSKSLRRFLENFRYTYDTVSGKRVVYLYVGWER